MKALYFKELVKVLSDLLYLVVAQIFCIHFLGYLSF